MELHELHVLDGGAGPVGHGDAVPGGHGIVGGMAVYLAHPAGAEHGGRPQEQLDAVAADVQGVEAVAMPGSRSPRPDRKCLAVTRSMARWSSRMVRFRCRRPASIKARWISWPVRSSACTMRWLECPPSLARWKGTRAAAFPPSARVKRTPQLTRSRMARGPWLTRMRTRSWRQSPAPATKVSRAWSSTESSGAITEAMPPWARLVDPAQLSFLVRTRTRPCSAAFRAKDSPAMPLPTTMKS